MVGAGVEGGSEVVKAESPTSDYGDESSDALEPGELTLNDQPHTQPSRSQPIPYNPQVSTYIVIQLLMNLIIDPHTFCQLASNMCFVSVESQFRQNKTNSCIYPPLFYSS